VQHVLRTIHHLSCSGGTLISKCIAAMQNIALASEVHPYNPGPYRYNPFDPVQLLLAGNMIESDKTRLDEIFRQRIELANRFCLEDKKTLVIRDHSHFDFLMKPEPSPEPKSVLNLLEADYHVNSVLTVRNPIDSFCSMNSNKWNHGGLDFDSYCKRVLIFLDAYKDFPLYKYENFCSAPESVMKAICKNLDITYYQGFINKFHQIELTGDSGRGKKLTIIRPLPEVTYSDAFRQEVARSYYYRAVSERLGYEL